MKKLKLNKLKRITALFMAVLLVVGMANWSSFGISVKAADEKASNEPQLEVGKTYVLPLKFYTNLNTYKYDEELSGTIEDFMDNIAVVSLNQDGAYHVTLQIENYEKIDILQIAKPGAIEDETKPADLPLGTYNIPSTYIYAYSNENFSDWTNYLKSQNLMSDEYNDKYIQDIFMEKADTGVTWYSFNVENLDKSLYVNSFYSYENETFGTYGKKSGRFFFDLSEIEEVKDYTQDNYSNVGLELAKVVPDAGSSSSYWNKGEGQRGNDCIKDGATGIKSDQKLSVNAKLSGVDTIQVLESITDIGDSATEDTLLRFQQYELAYSRDRRSTKIANYSDIELTDGEFSIEYSSLNELLFGKKVKFMLEDGTTCYGELRVKTSPKQSENLTDKNVSLITDSYNVRGNSLFAAELYEENTDENSNYNKYYSLLAGNASKALIYNLSLDNNNAEVNPTRAVELRVKIPDDWDTTKIEVQWYWTINEAFNPIEFFDLSSYKNDDGTIRMDGDELVITGTACVNGVIAITQKADKVDISEIQDGNYTVNITMWQMDQPDRLSMSNAAVVSDSAQLVVSENGTKKEIFFDTQSIVISGKNGYTNGISWANNTQTDTNEVPKLSEFTPLEYYSYYIDESGSTQMDSYAKDYNLYYPKTVGFVLPESADRDKGVYLDFSVPIMDELGGFTPGSGEGSRTAFMTLSGLTPVAEINEPTHDKSVLAVAVDKASKYEAVDYTDASYKTLSTAADKANSIIAGTTVATDSDIVALDKEITAAISGLVIRTEADKSKLTELVKTVENVKADDYTTSSYEALKTPLDEAKTVLNDEKATQRQVNAAYDKLNEAYGNLEKKQNTGLDYKNLPDGVYKLNVNMVKIDKVTASMSDGAIEHTVALTVKDGKYYLTVNFKGLRIGSDFGYLRELKYYLTGYTLDKYGNPVGELADTTVEGYWKNEDGTLVSDIYGSDYPNALTFELIPEALEDGYVPLQVFVPVMEAISEGTGEQNVFMKLDWTSLTKTTADDPDLKPAEPAKQLPAFSKTDDATGVKVDAAKGSFDTEVKFVVSPVTAGDVYGKVSVALNEVGKKFKVFDIHFEDADGNAVQPNGAVTIYLPIPEGYDASKVVLYRINDDGTKTLVKGSVENGYYKADTKHFSTYALVEKGSTITDADNTAQIEANKSAESIKTGDSANTILWAAVLMLAVAGMAGTFAVRRRKVKEQ